MQTLLTPNAPALESDTTVLSYAELQMLSCRLAMELRSLGARPHVDSVGICCGRSPAAYVAVLAVLRAGAAYVPLDPSYPADRLRIMIEDASPVVSAPPAPPPQLNTRAFCVEPTTSTPRSALQAIILPRSAPQAIVVLSVYEAALPNECRLLRVDTLLGAPPQ